MLSPAHYRRRLGALAQGLPMALARRGKLVWLPGAVVGAIAVAVIAWRLSLDVLPLAINLDDRLVELRSLPVAEVIARDSASLADLQRKVDRIHADVGHAARLMRWQGRFAPAVAWIPVLDHEVVAWAVQAHRLQRDLDTAATLLTASSELLDVYGEAQTVLLSPRVQLSTSHLTARAHDLGSVFDTALKDVSTMDRAGQRHRPVLRVYRMRDLLSLLGEVEERMLSASQIGEQASGLLVELLEIGALVQSLVAQFIADGTVQEPLSVDELRMTLSELDGRLQSTSANTSVLVELVADVEQSGLLLDRLDMLHQVLDVLQSVNDATMIGLQAVEPALLGTEGSTAGLLGSDGTLVNALNGVASHGDEIGRAVSVLDEAQHTLDALQSMDGQSARVGELGDLSAAVGLLREGLQLAKDIASIGARLVGADSTRHYLVLGHSADELRATGGFVSSV